MPLVLFTGFPGSGKTTYAKELYRLIEQKIASSPELLNCSVTYHSDDTLGIQHSDYVTSQTEKSARSKIMSAVKRDLSRTNVVIVDCLNYIKGFRYQLHCEVKNISTTYCLVQCLCPPESLAKYNANREDGWDPQLLEQLVQRYEEPNPSTRWDSPLFSVLTGEDKLEGNLEDAIYKVLFPQLYRTTSDRDVDKLLQGLKPSGATVMKPAAQGNQVHLLDAETQKVVRRVMAYLKDNVVAGVARIIVSDVQDVNDPLCCLVQVHSEQVTMAQLQRIRRQFVQMNKLRNLEVDRIVPLFTDFLTKNLDAGV